MPNPFDDLINDEFKQLFSQSIDALISGTEVPCKLIYPPTRFKDCTNCQNTNIGNRGPNPYLHGGRGTHTGPCAVCNGAKKIPYENSETINLVVIWEYKRFKDLASAVQAPDGLVQTVCNINLIEKIKDAQEIIFNTNIQAFANHYYRRIGEPTPAGLQQDNYILTNWEKIK